jgi:hypothetical protein
VTHAHKPTDQVQTGPPEKGVRTDAEKMGARRRRLIRRIVENRAAARLANEMDITTDEARKEIEAQIDDGTFDQIAEEHGVPTTLGDGKILQWLTDHGPQIKAMIEFIVALIKGLH